ncbi:MAG: 50S ribosomal protein L13 [Puniceicoccales bacterium]
MKTTLAKTDDPKQWFIVDAEGEVLGRLAVTIANVLRGRHKTTYTPHLDTGDYVVVINADKIKVTGRKEEDKQYMFHTGWVGNEYRRNVAHFRAKNPAFLIENAVKGMLPRNKLARHMIKKLKVYAGTEHPHEAQNPQPLKLTR